jgi:hypothetical protein
MHPAFLVIATASVALERRAVSAIYSIASIKKRQRNIGKKAGCPTDDGVRSVGKEALPTRCYGP